jgi:hypothetical protein
MLTKELTKDDVLVLQDLISILAKEINNYADSYKTMPILRTASIIANKYGRLQGVRNQVVVQLEVLPYPEVEYLLKQENKILGLLEEIFKNKSSFDDAALNNIILYCSDLLQLAEESHRRAKKFKKFAA